MIDPIFSIYTSAVTIILYLIYNILYIIDRYIYKYINLFAHNHLIS